MARARYRLVRQTSYPSARPIPSAPRPDRRSRCRRRLPLGWRCTRPAHPRNQACSTVPTWWNLWGAFWGRTR